MVRFMKVVTAVAVVTVAALGLSGCDSIISGFGDGEHSAGGAPASGYPRASVPIAGQYITPPKCEGAAWLQDPSTTCDYKTDWLKFDRKRDPSTTEPRQSNVELLQRFIAAVGPWATYGKSHVDGSDPFITAVKNLAGDPTPFQRTCYRDLTSLTSAETLTTVSSQHMLGEFIKLAQYSSDKTVERQLTDVPDGDFKDMLTDSFDPEFTHLYSAYSDQLQGALSSTTKQLKPFSDHVNICNYPASDGLPSTAPTASPTPAAPKSLKLDRDSEFVGEMANLAGTLAPMAYHVSASGAVSAAEDTHFAAPYYGWEWLRALNESNGGDPTLAQYSAADCFSSQAALLRQTEPVTDSMSPEDGEVGFQAYRDAFLESGAYDETDWSKALSITVKYAVAHNDAKVLSQHNRPAYTSNMSGSNITTDLKLCVTYLSDAGGGTVEGATATPGPREEN